MKARPTAAVSAKLMSAMPIAGAHIWLTRLTSGSVSGGGPTGIAPTSSMPRLCKLNRTTAAIAEPMTSNGAGQRGLSHSIDDNATIVSTPTMSVGTDVSGRCCTIDSRFSRKPPFAKCTPRILGT
jgi:hypothetical protein